MSTKERYGTEVWNALCRLHINPGPEQWGWHSVGEVAKEAGVSRATAKKYLQLLVFQGDASSVGKTSSRQYFQPSTEFMGS